jgi:hypothetical protein
MGCETRKAGGQEEIAPEVRLSFVAAVSEEGVAQLRRVKDPAIAVPI